MTAAPPLPLPAPPRPMRVAAGLLAVFVFGALCALGYWQLERRAWKLDLIARVDQRIAAAAMPAPGPDAWPQLTRAGDEYRRVALTGHFVAGGETLVRATTRLGPGYWVMTPLRSDRGFVALVNRGFIPADRRDAPGWRIGADDGPVTVAGLLRFDEPGGDLLRRNDPAAGRWYSRDVTAIAAAAGLDSPAPYFIDAGAAADPAAWPRGGLTVTRFNNNHLTYALTWFALAGMLGFAGLRLRGRA